MGQTARISRNNTIITGEPGSRVLTLHRTAIVRETPEGVTFDTGEWFTVTTKARMNQAMSEWDYPWRVGQCKGVWYARNWQTEEEIPFNGNLCHVPRS